MEQIHYRFDGASKHRRNLAITGGVAASILAAPIIAGLAVGKLLFTMMLEKKKKIGIKSLVQL